MWKLLIKQEILNMRSLTNKTAMMTNDAIQRVINLQNCVVSKTAKTFFSEKLIERTDVKAISSFHQLFRKKKIFLLFWIYDSVALTQFCKLTDKFLPRDARTAKRGIVIVSRPSVRL